MKKTFLFLNIFILLTFIVIKGFASPEYYVSRDNFAKSADKIISYYTQGESIRTNDVVFLNVVNIEHFFQSIYPKITNRFILITHGSDLGMPGKYSYILKDDKLIAWFAQNVDNYKDDKLIPIPIGIGYSFYNCDTRIFDKVRQKIITKKHLLYMNFNSGTHVERREVFSLFNGKPFCYHHKCYDLIHDFDKYLEDLASSCFVLSPRGTGLDCFRTWEALYLGSIPIVKTSSLDPLFEDLPVLIIDDWKCITEEFLIKKYNEMKDKKYNMEKLNMTYWKSLINSYKDAQ